MNRKKKFLIWIGGALIVLVLIVIIFFGYVFYGYKAKDYLQRRPFVSSEWKNEEAARKPPYPRLRMVDHLLSKEKLIGKTRKEVVALLGEPKKTEYFNEYDLVYWLGPERNWISIDSEWLIMRLDASDKVIECALTTD